MAGEMRVCQAAVRPFGCRACNWIVGLLLYYHIVIFSTHSLGVNQVRDFLPELRQLSPWKNVQIKTDSDGHGLSELPPRARMLEEPLMS